MGCVGLGGERRSVVTNRNWDPVLPWEEFCWTKASQIGQSGAGRGLPTLGADWRTRAALGPGIGSKP